MRRQHEGLGDSLGGAGWNEEAPGEDGAFSVEMDVEPPVTTQTSYCQQRDGRGGDIHKMTTI